MKFGTDQADEAGLPTWLESTIAVSRVVALLFLFLSIHLFRFPGLEFFETELERFR